MSKEELIDWIYNLPLQTLTDELKDDIVEKINDVEESHEYRKNYYKKKNV